MWSAALAWRIEFEDAALKELAKLDKPVARRILAFLRERYGLYIDQLPPGEGFAAPTIDERKALRSNVQAFTARLREIGFYRDLSDAYVTQTVVPRYTIAEKLEGART